MMSFAFLIAFGRHITHPTVEHMSGRKVSVETDSVMPVHFDGDPLGETPINCSVEPGAVRMLTPQIVPEALFLGNGKPFSS